MMQLYAYWMDKAEEMRAKAAEGGGGGGGPDYLIRAEQLEACAQDLLKAYLKGDP